MRRLLLALALVAAGCQTRPDLEQEKLELSARSLRPGFLLGTATAAHQIEGGNDNDWTDWENTLAADGTSHIENGDKSGAASKSWEKFDVDLALMKQLGTNAYRFSIEWSRLQPTRGSWDVAVEAHYRGWLRQLRAAGIEPMVTLLHFTLPKWVAAQGGFESRQTIADYEAFVRLAAAKFGPEVDFWCTINEPNVYAFSGYLDGEFPPGKQDNGLAADVLALQLEAHARASIALRETDRWDADGDGRATFIGLAHHVRVFQPATTSTFDTAITSLTDDFFNESIPRALSTGHIRLFVPGTRDLDVFVEGLQGSADWLGINYYTRDHVRADLGDETFSKQYVPKGRPTTSLGWESYPDGLYLYLKRLSALGVPLYVTENGLADNDDTRRVEYLQRHLLAVTRAAQEGVDVRGYFHWSLLDNFEWAQGFTPRFGLFQVDYQSEQRTRTPTAAVGTFRGFASAVGIP